MGISKQRVSEWLEDPVTRAYFQGLDFAIEQYKDELASGATLGELADQTTAKVVGIIQGLRAAREIDLETIITEE